MGRGLQVFQTFERVAKVFSAFEGGMNIFAIIEI